MHLTEEQAKLQAEQSQLKAIQSSLQQLAFSVAEFSLPSLFESSQTVTSNEPTRVSASVTSGAGVGGYEVEVTKLANSAQRTFTFTSPATAGTITIDGHEFTASRPARAPSSWRARSTPTATRASTRRCLKAEPSCCRVARPATRAANSSK